jgi:hypothetical protein
MTTSSGGGSIIPTAIIAEMEADWRAGLRSTPYKPIATTDGGTMWSTSTSTSTATSKTMHTLGSIYATTGTGTGSSIFPSGTKSWSFTPISTPASKPARLNKQQREMVMDAIAEQLVHPPRGHTWIPFAGHTSTYGSLVIGTVTSIDLADGESLTFTASYDEL